MPVRVNAKRRAAAPPPSSTGDALPFGLQRPPALRPQKPAGLSLCMIVKNEERFLAQCLRSVADVVDEIIIADTGSTDRTVEIAESFGAKIVRCDWRDDFAWARNHSIAPATKRWILFLDADEELMPESKAALLQLKDVPAYHDAVWVRCFNESDDYRGTGAMSHALIRIFPNCEEIRFRGMIHEFPSLNGDMNGLNGRMAPISIVHHGYLKDVVAERKKGERNYAIVKAATEKEPQEAFHWFNLGSTAFLVNDFDGARDALEEMCRVNGKQERGFIPNGLSLLAEIYCDKLHDPVKGEEVARRCLTLSPHYANAHFQLGKALVAQRRMPEAREAYEAAIADKAYAHLQFVLDDQVYVWKSHSEIGTTYVLEGNDAAAAEWFAKGLENAPGVEPLQINLARCLDRLARHDEAGATFRQAYEQHGDDMATVEYVNHLLRRGKGVEALQIIDASYEKLTESASAAMLLAGAQIASKLMLPTVRAYLERAAERAPHAAEVLNPLEATYREAGDDAALAVLLEREKATQPQVAADYLRRSFQALGAQDYRAAVELGEAGLRLSPNDARLAYNTALAYANLGEKQRVLDMLAPVTPESGDVFAAAAYLRAATERDLGRTNEALAALDGLLNADAQHVEALLLRATIHEQLGDPAGAEEDLKRVFAGERARGGVELASFYLRNQRFDDAARIATEALQS